MPLVKNIAHGDPQPPIVTLVTVGKAGCYWVSPDGTNGQTQGGTMPTTISLATYTVRLRNREDREYLPLDSFLGHDFFDVFRDYLEERKDTASEDEERQKLLRAIDYEEDERTIGGTLEAGDYGFEADLYDVNTQSLSYTRKPTDAELLPFYFLLSVPNNSDRGILILERFRQYGIRSTLWEDFSEFFDPYKDDVSIQLNPLVPSGLIEQIRQGENVRSIRFIHFGLPNDVANALGAQGSIREEDGVLEYVIKARRGGHLPLLERISAALRGEAALPQIAEITGFDFDTVKIQLDIEGRSRTMDLSDPEGIRAQYDVTDDVQLDDSGHPSYPSIDTTAREILDELHEQLGIQ